MGFVRHDPKELIWQSDITFALNAPDDFLVVNVAKEIENPKAKIWLQYDDFVPIDVEDLHLVAKIAKTRFERGEKTLIHCIAGAHRSVTFSLASLIYVYNVKIKEAMKMLCPPCIDFNTYVNEVPFHFLSLQEFYTRYIR
ncbi:putative phosphatase [Betalipothrixvirus pezzuloense]|uniref:Putative phosphatase n=1 Tax=Betalipothrixvirus pezzuloense TaxID=346883 RepID=A7WKR9_9VIRU|nr:putative phosphatase [Acidianus filamentous virus 7]CAJ31672.1 putative phosphatase [Acidianus filamentous virus 7]